MGSHLSPIFEKNESKNKKLYDKFVLSYVFISIKKRIPPGRDLAGFKVSSEFNLF